MSHRRKALALAVVFGLALPITPAIAATPKPTLAQIEAAKKAELAKRKAADAAAKKLGSTLKAPYMLLSFMALLVIPELKLSDKGLFDGGSFKFTPLQIN